MQKWIYDGNELTQRFIDVANVYQELLDKFYHNSPVFSNNKFWLCGFPAQ